LSTQQLKTEVRSVIRRHLARAVNEKTLNEDVWLDDDKHIKWLVDIMTAHQAKRPRLVSFRLEDSEGSMTSSLLKAVGELEKRRHGGRKSMVSGTLSSALMELAVQFNCEPEARELLDNRRLKRENSFKLGKWAAHIRTLSPTCIS
jgi:hypothetical protein